MTDQQVAFKQPRLTKTAVPSVFTSAEDRCRNGTFTATVEPQNDRELQQSRDVNQKTILTENIGLGIDSNTATQSLVGDVSKNVFPTLENEFTIPVENVAAYVDTFTSDSSSLELEPTIPIPEETNATSIQNHNAFQRVFSKIEVMSEDNQISSTRNSAKNSSTFGETFFEIYNDGNSVKLPLGWFRYTSSNSAKRWVAFSTFDVQNNLNCLQPVLRKSILLTEEGKVHVSANGKGVPLERLCRTPDRICSVEDFSRVLISVATVKVCSGIELPSHLSIQSEKMHRNVVGDWYNKNCSIVCAARICRSCQRLKKSMSQRMRRASKRSIVRKLNISYASLAEQSKIVSVKRKLRSQRVFIGRVKKRVKKLHDSITELQDRIRSLEEESIMKKCDKMNLSQAQRLCIKEMIASVNKKNLQANHYNEDWVMLCMLMHIRSPEHYKFLLKNEILPLPSLTTIRCFLSMNTTNCGFDTNFVKSFTKRMASKSPMLKHGVLLLDEISYREAVAACSPTYKRFTDVSDTDTDAINVNDKGKYGLVFMFKAIADKNTQPIALFASKGPLEGPELAKIVVRAITLLESAGAKIHAVVSDEAFTYRNMWSCLGINGEINTCKTSFAHPCDNARHVFAISDILQLIKSIRNRLYDSGEEITELLVDPCKHPVKWCYFRAMYKEDIRLPSERRKCPQIKDVHINLGTEANMDASLATQIFSNSVADALEFYHRRGLSELDGCEATVEFCRTVNAIFDVLSKKPPNGGLTPNGKYMEVLKNSLQWLNDWESKYATGLIREDQFLLKSTTEGLRVTLQSIMEMCRYLCDKFEFEYLLTGEMYQNSLEIK